MREIETGQTTLRIYSVDEVKAMDTNTLIEEIEAKLGQRLDASIFVLLSILKGVGDRRTSNLSNGQRDDETIDWEAITRILNSPAKPPLPPYEGPKLIFENTKHFADAVMFAIEHSPTGEKQDTNTADDVRNKKPIDSLMEGFADLRAMAENYAQNGWHFEIRPDFMKHSFSFVCYDAQEKPVFNGGLILHLSWNSKTGHYEDDDKMHWSIHT